MACTNSKVQHVTFSCLRTLILLSNPADTAPFCHIAHNHVAAILVAAVSEEHISPPSEDPKRRHAVPHQTTPTHNASKICAAELSPPHYLGNATFLLAENPVTCSRVP